MSPDPLPPAGEPTLAELLATVREALAKAGEESHTTMRDLTAQYIDGDGALYFVRLHQVALYFLLAERDQFNEWLARLVDGVREQSEQLKWTERALAIAKDYAAELKDENDTLWARLDQAVPRANHAEVERRKSEDEALHWQESYVALQSKLADAETMREPLRWLVHLCNGVGKAGEEPETGEWAAAAAAGQAALWSTALSPPVPATHQEEGSE